MQLALAEEVAREDALENAERLGEGADAFAVTEDGHGAQVPVQSAGSSSGESALLAWHVLGSVRLERIECPACSAVCEADDESTEIPACPACGVRDTWESRQGPAFRELVEEIGGCSSLEQLALVGKQLYARPLPHEQASVAWSHFQLRKRALEAAVTLGAPARADGPDRGRVAARARCAGRAVVSAAARRR